MSEIKWHRIVLDEAQNIKNPKADLKKSILKLTVPPWLALTGTPIENRLLDFWLTKEQASLYEAVVKDVEAQLQGTEGIYRKGLILATLTKLKQVCKYPMQFLQKVPAKKQQLKLDYPWIRFPPCRHLRLKKC